MATPNKTVSAARRKMGGFPRQEPTEARKAEQQKFSEMVSWASAQMVQGRSFASMEEVESAFQAEVAGSA